MVLKRKYRFFSFLTVLVRYSKRNQETHVSFSVMLFIHCLFLFDLIYILVLLSSFLVRSRILIYNPILLVKAVIIIETSFV